MKSLAAVVFLSDYPEYLPEVTVPSLIMQYSEDSIVPLESAEYLHKYLENIRNVDLFFRFGGEEYLILMPATNLEKSKLILEKIRQAVEEINHWITGKQIISISVAERYPRESFIDWYKRTDQALYRAKVEGRNRVVAASILY